MKRVLLASLCLASALANAECYVRTTTTISRSALLVEPTDFQQIVSPDTKGVKCAIRYRVNVDGEWETVEGVGVHNDSGVACAKAIKLDNAVVLKEPTRDIVKADQQMVCSDLPDIRVRPVRVGEKIWESETDLHRNPNERKYFVYKNTKCRMFTERETKNGNLQTYQGVICKADTNSPKWIVVDKY